MKSRRPWLRLTNEIIVANVCKQHTHLSQDQVEWTDVFTGNSPNPFRKCLCRIACLLCCIKTNISQACVFFFNAKNKRKCHSSDRLFVLPLLKYTGYGSHQHVRMEHLITTGCGTRHGQAFQAPCAFKTFLYKWCICSSKRPTDHRSRWTWR